MSGVSFDHTTIYKGAPDTMIEAIQAQGGAIPPELRLEVDKIARNGGTPLVVSRNDSALGVIHLKDIVKGGLKERFAQLRKWASKR